MGVRLLSVTPLVAEANGLGRALGVYIDEVLSGSPSDGVLQGSEGETTVDGQTVPTGGDVITRLDDTPVPTRQALSSFLALETNPGTRIDVELLRDGERRTVQLALGSRPEP
jgi:S1-C subfamily serine protease